MMKTFLKILAKILLVFFVLATMFAVGGVAAFFYDAYRYELATGVTLQKTYDAKEQCEAISGEECLVSGYFIPKSILMKPVFDIDKGI
jgi:hypothetical protein